MSGVITFPFIFRNETLTCYRFENGKSSDKMTLYLKKAQVDAAGIDPKKGITVTVEEACQ